MFNIDLDWIPNGPGTFSLKWYSKSQESGGFHVGKSGSYFRVTLMGLYYLRLYEILNPDRWMLENLYPLHHILRVTFFWGRKNGKEFRLCGIVREICFAYYQISAPMNDASTFNLSRPTSVTIQGPRGWNFSSPGFTFPVVIPEIHWNVSLSFTLSSKQLHQIGWLFFCNRVGKMQKRNIHWNHYLIVTPT